MRELVVETGRARTTTTLLVNLNVEEAVFVSQRIYGRSWHPGRATEEVSVPLGVDPTRALWRDQHVHHGAVPVTQL